MAIFYKDKPVIGFDIGRTTLKVMQIDRSGAKKKAQVVAYGSTTFDEKAIEKGVIVDIEELAKSAHKLMTKELVGKVTTNHVAVSLPNEHSFSRVITLPKMERKDLLEAVRLEVDQSIPMPSDELYFDYSVVRALSDGTIELQIVACPKKIVDSYMSIFKTLGLEVALLESNISAVTRMVIHSEAHDVTTLIVDFGSSACDLSVYDGNSIRATGTVDCSGVILTKNIAKALNVTEQQAHSIKTRYGLDASKKQKEILDAVEPELAKLVYEIRKVIRYFSDREKTDMPIGQIIILGGGANLPGLSGYITNKTRVPTRLCAPWNHLTFGKLQPPHELETTLYTTAGGLGLVTEKELKV